MNALRCNKLYGRCQTGCRHYICMLLATSEQTGIPAARAQYRRPGPIILHLLLARVCHLPCANSGKRRCPCGRRRHPRKPVLTRCHPAVQPASCLQPCLAMYQHDPEVYVSALSVALWILATAIRKVEVRSACEAPLPPCWQKNYPLIATSWGGCC